MLHLIGADNAVAVDPEQTFVYVSRTRVPRTSISTGSSINTEGQLAVRRSEWSAFGSATMRSVVAGVGTVNKANSDLPPSLVIHQYSGGAVLDPSLTISEALT